jgi:DNA-binding NtrC family response regulator
VSERAPEPSARAVVIAPLGATGSLRVLLERLAGLGIEVDIVDELSDAAEVVAQHGDAPPVLMLDLRELASEDVEDVRRATDAVRTVLAAIPPCSPVVITGEADAAMIVACVRAGAGDVIDIQLEGTAAARGVVERVFRKQRERADQLTQAGSLRTMVEDLLKDLIRTERRSIDLEEQLARKTREFPSPMDTRPAAILLVEPDRQLANHLVEKLEAAEITTYAYITGDDAVRAATNLSMGQLPLFDLALVAAQLPDTDGLATIQRLRDKARALPAFLMTSVHDTALAERAADLGVVGFVHKPLSDLDDVVGRLAQLARESLSRTREHAYLERIKARHERVLARYQRLSRGDS